MDYRSMEGENIPYKKYGYPSLEDFLKASGEFSLLNRNDEVSVRHQTIPLHAPLMQFSFNSQIIVSMKLSKASEHILNLVRGQKTSAPVNISF